MRNAASLNSSGAISASGTSSGRPSGAGGTSGPLGIGPQFFASTFRVMGHVAKADGRVTVREIEAARGIMQSLRLGEPQVREAIALFTAKDAAGVALPIT